MPPRPGPLVGIRVVDFTWVAAGPASMMLLALLGADVIKLESPRHTDYTRIAYNPGYPDPDAAPVFNALNLNKRSVTLDLRDPRGNDLARRLILSADVFVEGMRPGVAAGLGFEYPELRQAKPDLVMVSMSGFGQVGREARYASYAPIFGASGGMSHMTGYPDGIPTQMRASADMRGGLALLAPILAALRAAKQDGRGAYIDVAAVEANACLVGELILDTQMNGRDASRRGNDHPQMAPHGVYETNEPGVFLSVACRDDRDWKGLCQVLPALARPEFALARDRWKRRSEVDELLREITRTWNRAELKNALQSEHVPAVECMSNKDVFEDAHAHERGLWVSVEHPRQGMPWAIGLPWISSQTGRGIPARRAPLYHEHTREIVQGELGVTDDEWTDLLESGVVGVANDQHAVANE